MKNIKRSLLPLSSNRTADANEDYNLNTNSMGVRGSTYSGSHLAREEAKEGGPWGLKELCPGKDPIVDIVAVHGLNGHREKTWTCNETSGDNVLWLRDLLPNRIPGARVWTWGYDSRTHTRSHRDYLTTKKLYDHGRELVFDLEGARRESKSHQRPIIFIAHSLGGIVVKNALLHSDRVKEGNLEEQRSIKLSTYGIIFMGTPHHGGHGVGIGKILLNVAKMQGDVSDSLLKHLEEHSELLQQQISEFSLISQSFDIKFAYETQPTLLAGVITRVIVPKWSAVVSGTPDAAEFGINADHRNMTKFSNTDNEDFKKLSCTLELMVQKSSSKVEANWALEARMKQAILLKIAKQTFMVPFERDSKFVGRRDIIANLDEKLNGQRRIALAGIGGIGKSQIAIEYCYRFRDRHPDASVLWVHVGTISRFKQAYEEIAKNLSLVEKDDQKANTLQLVTDWLNNTKSGNWLMVLDNADDQAVFESRSLLTEASEQSMPLVCYLPHSQKGSIIITTRDKRVGQRLTAREKPIMVSSFDGPMAKTLLRSKLDQSIEWIEEDANKLVKALDSLPLAITQAAAFISENNITVKEYTDILQASDSGLANLLNQDLIDLRRDFDASSSIIRTWQVSFDQIRVQKTEAAELLSPMAVLDRQGIPKALLREYSKEQVEIVTALGTLQAFSLISSDKKGEAFEMHRLVQLSTLKWLEMQNEKPKWQERALGLLSANFPNGRFETWETCALYLPHVMIVIESLVLGPDHVNELGLLVDTANYLRSQGHYDMAEQIIRQALELYEKAYGIEHPDTLRSMTMLGKILDHQGKYDGAEELLQKVLILREKTLGGKHELTLSTINALARVLIRKGKYEEVKKILEQNVKLGSEILGEEHENTLDDMKNLATVYYYLHQFSKAEELEVYLLRVREKFLGAEHPDVLQIMANIAVTYARLNRLNEAEQLNLQVLERRKRVLGGEHPDTLRSMAGLAMTYKTLSRLNEAEELEAQVLEKRTKALGAEHPDTLRSMANLAVTYAKLNRLDEAEELEVQVLEKCKKVLGAEHPDTLGRMANLAVTYKTLNRLNEAEELEAQALEKRTKALGAEHPDTLRSMANLAETYTKLNRLNEAEKSEMQVLEKRQKFLGAKHPDPLLSMANLAVTYAELNRLNEAEELEVQVLEKRQKVLGAEHPDTLGSMANLAVTYAKLNRLNEAEELRVQVLDARRKFLGAEHPDTLRGMANLAWTWKLQDHLKKAIPLMSDTVRLSRIILGADDPDLKDRQQLLNAWIEECDQKTGNLPKSLFVPGA
ncbi:hypothetical protein MMC22_002428 [Lobaria immixta]|nr:hypothetical protein [Lobaria immixta]